MSPTIKEPRLACATRRHHSAKPRWRLLLQIMIIHCNNPSRPDMPSSGPRQVWGFGSGYPSRGSKQTHVPLMRVNACSGLGRVQQTLLKELHIPTCHFQLQVTLHLQIDELPFTKVATCFLDGSTDEILQGLDPHLPAPFT